MEYQITNEISEFWFDLVPPIFLGGISIICFLWVLGKDNRLRLMKYFVHGNNNRYIEKNGILIPKEQTTEYIFRKKFLSDTGLDSMKPIVVIFLVFLFFYGLNHILLMTFQPLLTLHPDGIFFAAGIDEYTLASLWIHYHASSISDLYQSMVELMEIPTTRPAEFLDSVRCYIQFDLFCCLIFYFLLLIKRHKIHSHRKVLLRLLLFIFILFLLLGCILLAEIYTYNNEIYLMCNQAYAMLDQGSNFDSTLLNNEAFQDCLQEVQQHKEQASRHLFYGAYGISNHFVRPWKFIAYVYQELYRVLRLKINNML